MERSGVAAMALGIVERCLELSVKYAKERVQFGRPIGEFQLIQDKLARMEVARMNLQNLVFRTIELSAQGGRMSFAEASAMKLYAARAAVEVAMEAVQVYGGNGYMAEYQVEQLARDAKVLQIYSLAASWAFLEFAVMPRLIDRAPLGRQVHFTGEMQVLAQDTKDGLVAKDYILLLGDSHAKGIGDWLLSVDPSGHPPYHSAHVLRDSLGRDVLNFGEGGASSVDALVRRPRQHHAALARYGLGPPEQVVVYFYEGNDLSDNERFLARAVRDGADRGRLGEADYLDELLRGQIERDRAWFRRLRSKFFTVRYVSKLLEAITDRLRGSPSEADAPRQEPVGARSSRARVGGRDVGLPDRLQSPALELDGEAWGRALLVFARSLASLRELYRTQPILVVYIPSPLSCYEITSSSVAVATARGRYEVHSTERLERRSIATRRRVAEIAEIHALEFLDLTPPLRDVAAQEPAHGPLDWHHPNERGYRAIGRAVAERLGSPAPGLRRSPTSRLQ